MYLYLLFIVLSEHCRVVKFTKKDNEISIEYKIPNESIQNGFPETVMYNYELRSDKILYPFFRKILKKLKFESSEVFETFLSKFLGEISYPRFEINSENLKLIIKSESLRRLIEKYSEINIRPSFTINLKGYLMLSMSQSFLFKTYSDALYY